MSKESDRIAQQPVDSLLGGPVGPGGVPIAHIGVPAGYKIVRKSNKYPPGTKLYRQVRKGGKVSFVEIDESKVGAYKGTLYLKSTAGRSTAKALQQSKLGGALGAGARSIGAGLGANPNIDYQAATGTRTEITPRYQDGAQMKPGGWTDAQRADLQRKMVAAGLLPKNFRAFGIWDDTSVTAYESLLGLANRQGESATTMLQKLQDSGGLGPDDAPDPLITEVSNPEDLRETIRASAYKLLKRKIRPEEEDRLIAQFQQMERDEQANAYAKTNAAAGGEITTGVSTDVFFNQKIRDLAPAEADAAGIADLGNEFFGLLGEGGMTG